MKLQIIIASFVALILGCSKQPADAPKAVANPAAPNNEPLPPEVAKAMQGISLEQSQGLKNATVLVHRAYEYHGFSRLDPIDTAKLIAVDVEFRNYTQGLDLDDVDIVNGQTDENYGSDPQIASLTLDGQLAKDVDNASWPENLGPLRMLLIYAYPKNSQSIKLSYWGQELTPKPIPLQGEGPSLPKPMAPAK